LWNQDVIFDETLMKQASLIITEGHLDALSIMTVGFSAVTSVPDGASVARPSEDGPEARAKYSYLAEIRDQLRKWPSVIIATDSDAPGRALFDDLARIVGRAKCRVMEYPSDCKDANDVLVRHGPEALVAAVEKARWVHIGGIYEFDTIPPMEVLPAVKCGISGIDDLWRFRPGELSVIVGIPNHGKTLLMNQMALGLAQHHGWVTAFCSPEQSYQVHISRLITTYLGKPARTASQEERKRAEDFLRAHFVWLGPEGDADMTVDWFCERVATVAWRYNAKLVIMDPWNQMDHNRDVLVTLNEYSGEMLKRMMRTAVSSGVHIMVMCHPHKPTGHRDGKVPPPNGYSIADSAYFVNRPDLGATLYRDESKGRTMFWVWKARYADGEWYDNGKVATRMLGLNKMSLRFIAMEQEEEEDLDL